MAKLRHPAACAPSPVPAGFVPIRSYLSTAAKHRECLFEVLAMLTVGHPLDARPGLDITASQAGPVTAKQDHPYSSLQGLSGSTANPATYHEGRCAVSDTVEFGGWPRPPRWVWAIAGVAAVAVLAGVVVTHAGPQRAAPTSAVTGPAAPGNGGLRMPPHKPARMVGRPLPRGAGLRLVVGGQRPAWLWVATGRTEPIGGLPRRDNGYQLIRIAGGWAALPFPGNGVSCDRCAPGRMPVYYIADGSRKASRLGGAVFAAPAATSGAVWLISYRAGAVMPATAGAAQEFSVSGAALGPRRRLPRGEGIDQGTAAGLLLAPELAGPGVIRYRLWEPGTHRVSHSFQDVIAASPGEIAWMPACTVRCTVHVLNLEGGPGRVIALPGGSQAYAGAFSPDGRLLALQITAPIGASGQPSATRLVVAALATGRLTAVPGTTIGGGIGVEFGWQGNGQLVADVGLQDGWQVAAWRPGDARLYVAVARVPADSWPVVGPGPY